MPPSPRAARTAAPAAPAALAVLAALAAAAHAPARAAAAGAQPADGGARVVVSATEARVLFTRDAAARWGWDAARAPAGGRSYAWSVYVDGMDGPHVLHVGVGPAWTDLAARRFASLGALLAARRLHGVCRPRMVMACDSSAAAVAAVDGRVALTLRDPARVARLFALRPAWVRLVEYGPGPGHRGVHDSVRVEYVAPHVPAPTAATFAAAETGRRRYRASVTTVTRRIRRHGGHDDGDTLWMAAGDTTPLVVQESWCMHDVCSSAPRGVTDGGWSADDAALVRLLTARDAAAAGEASFGAGPVRALPLRPGRTVVRVRGLRGESDTVASAAPAPRALERPVRVVPPVGRVEIAPRPSAVRQGERVRFEVRAFTRGGERLDGAPAELTLVGGPRYRHIHPAARGATVAFDSAGRHLLVGLLLGVADTVAVDVRAAAPRP